MTTTKTAATRIAGKWRRRFELPFAGKRVLMGCACEIAMEIEMRNAGARVIGAPGGAVKSRRTARFQLVQLWGPLHKGECDETSRGARFRTWRSCERTVSSCKKKGPAVHKSIVQSEFSSEGATVSSGGDAVPRGQNVIHRSHRICTCMHRLSDSTVTFS